MNRYRLGFRKSSLGLFPLIALTSLWILALVTVSELPSKESLPGRPQAPEQGSPPTHASWSVRQLIDHLIRETQPGPGYDARPSQIDESSPAALDKPAAATGVPEEGSPVVRELLRRGREALPELLNHLDDARPTGIHLLGDNLASPIIIANEYAPRDSHPDRRPPGTVSSFMEKGALQDAPGVETLQGERVRYTLRVGDLCYALTGRIINRPLFAARNQPAMITIVNSPVQAPALARACRADWSNLTAGAHCDQLTLDANRPEWTLSALRALLAYYPREGNVLWEKCLRRPLYDPQKIDGFITETLTSLASLPEETRERIESSENAITLVLETQNRCRLLASQWGVSEWEHWLDRYGVGIMDPSQVRQRIAARILPEPLPPKYREVLADFEREMGATALGALPRRIRAAFHDPAKYGDMVFFARKRKADAYLETAFAPEDPFGPGFFPGATVEEQLMLVRGLGTPADERTKAALWDLFQKVSATPNLASYPHPQKHALARACITRLIGQGHDQEFRKYLENQIADIQNHYNDSYRRIDKQEFALLESLKKR